MIYVFFIFSNSGRIYDIKCISCLWIKITLFSRIVSFIFLIELYFHDEQILFASLKIIQLLQPGNLLLTLPFEVTKRRICINGIASCEKACLVDMCVIKKEYIRESRKLFFAARQNLPDLLSILWSEINQYNIANTFRLSGWF